MTTETASTRLCLVSFIILQLDCGSPSGSPKPIPHLVASSLRNAGPAPRAADILLSFLHVSNDYADQSVRGISWTALATRKGSGEGRARASARSSLEPRMPVEDSVPVRRECMIEIWRENRALRDMGRVQLRGVMRSEVAQHCLPSVVCGAEVNRGWGSEPETLTPAARNDTTPPDTDTSVPS